MFRKILLPIDLDAPSSWTKPVAVAVEAAAREGAEIHVLAVLP